MRTRAAVLCAPRTDDRVEQIQLDGRASPIVRRSRPDAHR
jgi:hypothetical protein